MTLKFIHPTAAQLLRLASIVLTIANFFLAYAATIKTLSFIPPTLAMYWPVIFGVAAVIHQSASTFGVLPDAVLADKLVAVTSGLTPPAPINAAEYRAGMNIAMRGDQLVDDASRSAKAGFDCVPDSERGKYDANGVLKSTPV